jgi:ferrous iron transport protein B
MKEVVPLLFLATAGLFFIDRYISWQNWKNCLLRLSSAFLGLPLETTSTFIMGFLRRDYGASGIYDLAQQGLLSPSQILVSSVVITLFVPCLAKA